jgi:hypothetical protein
MKRILYSFRMYSMHIPCIRAYDAGGVNHIPGDCESAVVRVIGLVAPHTIPPLGAEGGARGGGDLLRLTATRLARVRK